MARRWGEIFGLAAEEAGAAWVLRLNQGEIRFVLETDGRGPGVAGVVVESHDIDGIKKRAQLEIFPIMKQVFSLVEPVFILAINVKTDSFANRLPNPHSHELVAQSSQAGFLEIGRSISAKMRPWVGFFGVPSFLSICDKSAPD